MIHLNMGIIYDRSILGFPERWLEFLRYFEEVKVLGGDDPKELRRHPFLSPYQINRTYPL